MCKIFGQMREEAMTTLTTITGLQSWKARSRQQRQRQQQRDDDKFMAVAPPQKVERILPRGIDRKKSIFFGAESEKVMLDRVQTEYERIVAEEMGKKQELKEDVVKWMDMSHYFNVDNT